MLELKWFMGEKEDLSEVHALRREVFIDEQGVPEAEEYDGTDGSCVHLLILDDGVPVATGRVLVTDDDGHEFHLGRIATVKSRRGEGLGTNIIEQLIGACVAMGGVRQTVHAQISAREFYEKLGFTAYGDIFDDAGIPHIAMERFGGIKKCGEGHCGQCAAHGG